eukprot:2913394-Lingulodinium_polyedra.AAC.1
MGKPQQRCAPKGGPSFLVSEAPMDSAFSCCVKVLTSRCHDICALRWAPSPTFPLSVIRAHCG